MAAEQIQLARGTGRLVAWLGRQVEHVLSGLDLSPAQYRFLALLEEKPEVASVLAGKLTVSRPSVTTVADGLVARGLVERGGDAGDRRRVTHVLTEAGRELLHRADGLVEESLGEFLAEMAPRAARDAAAGLAALAELLSKRLQEWQPER